jgi:hypothetical protein
MRSREARALYIPLLHVQALVVPLLLRNSYEPCVVLKRPQKTKLRVLSRELFLTLIIY